MKIISGHPIVNKKRLIFSKKIQGGRCPREPDTGMEGKTLFFLFQGFLQILPHLIEDILPEAVQRHGVGHLV